MPVRSLLKFLPLLVPVLCVVLVADAKTLLLDDSDNNSHLCLYVGDTLTIKLTSNPTTGYSWAKPQAFRHLKLITSRSERGSSDRVGSPGFQVFSFKATEPGESALDLNYLRPFEKNTPPAKMFHLSVKIETRPTTKAENSATP
jgi:inhibitor of cysteine peptidase